MTADPDDPAKFQIVMGGQASTGNVANLFAYLTGNPRENPDFIIGRFLNTFEDTKTSVLRESDIVAVIRTRDYVENSDGASATLHEPLGADLVIVYMADRPDSIAAIGSDDVQARIYRASV